MRYGMTLFLGFLIFTVTCSSANTHNFDIPFKKYVLENGLTLIVHEDHKAPVVSVSVWYHVGSKDEPAGRTGFAHLFEHLMFLGSENYNNEYTIPFDRAGASELNGSTYFDYTNYYQVVPKEALDLALWMESDRMGHFIDAVTQEKLANERDVVTNEKFEYESDPYTKVYLKAYETLFGTDHPYGHPIIGAMDDLNAASLDDVKSWFSSYYGAANTTLVIAGDITPKEANAKVDDFFGHIGSGPSISKTTIQPTPLSNSIHINMQDEVPGKRLYLFWKIPAFGDPDVDQLNLVSDLLVSGENSRLFQRLVVKDKLATSVHAETDPLQMAGVFELYADLVEGADPETVRKAILDEIAIVADSGPTDLEVKALISRSRSKFLRENQRVGTENGKSYTLAMNDLYMGDPGYFRVSQERIANATSATLQQAANEWLTKPSLTVNLTPFFEVFQRASIVDRGALPSVNISTAASFGDIQTARLNNGLNVMLLKRESIPMVAMELLVDAGRAADRTLPGISKMTLSLLEKGTKELSASQIVNQLGLFGANLSFRNTSDTSNIRIEALSEHFVDTARLFSQVIQYPTFPTEALERYRQKRIVDIENTKIYPDALADRLLMPLMYGSGHPYGGIETQSALHSLTSEDLATFHQKWYTPPNSTLLVVGDVELDNLKEILEASFKDWRTSATSVKPDLAILKTREPNIYFVDAPGEAQSTIVAGQLISPSFKDSESAIDVLNDVFGGSFNSRLNVNLRQQKNWTYGAWSAVPKVRGSRLLYALTSVPTDKTTDAIREIEAEFIGISTNNKPGEGEISVAKQRLTLPMSAQFQTMGSIIDGLNNIARFDLDLKYWEQLATDVEQVSQTDVHLTAEKLFNRGNRDWIVIGDKEALFEDLKRLKLGSVIEVNADGMPKGHRH